MKHFEQNLFEDGSLEDLHHALGMGSAVVLSNLFFHEANDEADCPRHRMKLAKSAYKLIAVCEAVIARVPEGEREKAREAIAEEMKPMDADDFDAAIEAAVKLFFG